MLDAKSEMGLFSADFRPDDAEPINATPAPIRTPAAVAKSTREVTIREGWYRVRRTVTVDGASETDKGIGRSIARRHEATDLADECYEGRPDCVEDALIAVIDGQLRGEQIPSRTLATMAERGTRKRGRWLEGKVRKGAVPRM